jgi:hypothetical protein
VDIPADLADFMDELTSSRKAKSRREIVVKALAYYRSLTMFDWDEDRILVRKLRRGLLTQRSLEQLTLKMTEDELYEAGKRMAQTLLDSLLATSGKDPREPENRPLAIEVLSSIGWGKFTLLEDRVVVNSPFLSKHLLLGYLERGLGLRLRLVHTMEDVGIFQIEGAEGG